MRHQQLRVRFQFCPTYSSSPLAYANQNFLLDILTNTLSAMIFKHWFLTSQLSTLLPNSSKTPFNQLKTTTSNIYIKLSSTIEKEECPNLHINKTLIKQTCNIILTFK